MKLLSFVIITRVLNNPRSDSCTGEEELFDWSKARVYKNRIWLCCYFSSYVWPGKLLAKFSQYLWGV